MPILDELIRELAQHAIVKKGAQQDASCAHYDVLEYPRVEVPAAGSWSKFFEIDQKRADEAHFALMPVHEDVLERHCEKYPNIRRSSWSKRDGHVFMEVPLDSSVPIEFLKSLIDDAYAIIWNKLDADGRLLVDLASLPYDESKLLDRLIEIHNLTHRRTDIQTITRLAILLRTKDSKESEIPLGATKIGGQPDLSAKTEWPMNQDGKPLAFLTQIDLEEIAKLGTPIKGLPTVGLLSVFSAWGWLGAGESPDDCTIVLHTLPGIKLERRETPDDVNSFKAAAVEPTPVLSLPPHRVEPSLTSLSWTDDEYERFDRMQMNFDALKMGHWLNVRQSGASHHQLGGYALFQQEFPVEVLKKGLAMFLQIGTDDNTNMCWEDGGELTFYADAKALAKGRFERVWGTCQGG